jgi:hypothetical protein
MSWLSRFFPVRSLERVGSGAQCVLTTKIVTADEVGASLSPTRGAAIRWTLLYEHTRARSDRSGGGPLRSLIAFATGWRGGPLTVRGACGRTVEVSLERARLTAPMDPEDGVPLGSSPESARVYGEVAARAPAMAGVVYLREQLLTCGQALVVRGRIEPVAVGAGYRDSARTTPPFRTVSDVMLEDHALD